MAGAGGGPSGGGAGGGPRRRWKKVAAALGDETMAVKTNDGAGDEDEDEDELLRSRAPMTYIGADPLTPARVTSRC